MKNATYLSSSNFVKPSGARKKIRSGRNPLAAGLLSLMSLVLVFMSSFAAFGDRNSQEAESFDVVQFVMCMWGDDSMPRHIYQASQSSDIQFQLLSKSALNYGIDSVDGGLNQILNIWGPDYVELNEEILGIPLEYHPDDERELEFNGGTAVSPYDRFGVAGLKFSAYQGEWRHIVIDACSNADPQDPETGLFYDGRLEPQSTWEGIDTSRDARTIQHSRGFMSKMNVSFSTLVANTVFMIPKSFVVITNGLISFAFSDVIETLGIAEYLYGASDGDVDNPDSVVATLHENFFVPFLYIAYGILGMWVLYQGIGRRAYRDVFGTLLRSFIMLIIAFVLAAAPQLLAIPNKAVVTVQSLIMTSMSDTINSQGGLCETNVGAFSAPIADDTGEPEETLASVSENVRSVVNCTFWETFLVQPWVEGQFGTDFNQLWAEDTEIPDWAEDGSTIGNVNGEWVGDAFVPLGDGTYLNNWAIFHLSTQTNVHAPVGEQGMLSPINSGASNDWWRIVDAFSNYAETDESYTAGGETIEVTVIDESAKPVDEWDVWAGNSPWTRVGVASSATLATGIGLLAPFIFGLMAAVYSIGFAILIVLTPLMMIFGIGAGRSWEIFKGWLSLLLKVGIRRILLALLLTLSILLTMVAIEQMNEVSWWQGMLLLVLFTVAILKSRNKLMDFFTDFNLSRTANFDQGARKISGAFSNTGKGIGKTAFAGAAGGIAAKRAGGSGFKGMIAGSKNELRNQAYRSEFGRNMMNTSERIAHHTGKSNFKLEDEFCAKCGKKLGGANGEQILGQDGAGNYYCRECLEDGVAPEDTREIVINNNENDKEAKKTKLGKSEDKRSAKMSRTRTTMNNRWSKDARGVISTGMKGDQEVSDERRERIFSQMVNGVSRDIARAEKKFEESGELVNVEMPPELEPYMNKRVLADAWKDRNYDYIQNAYTVAWATWYQDKTGLELDVTLDDLASNVAHETQNLRDERRRS